MSNEVLSALIEKLKSNGWSGPEDAAQKSIAEVAWDYGGAPQYIAKQKKDFRAVQVAKLAKHKQIEIAIKTGLTVRQVRRIQRGK